VHDPCSEQMRHLRHYCDWGLGGRRVRPVVPVWRPPGRFAGGGWRGPAPGRTAWRERLSRL
jgi:hypothetical protein